jgi:hypothetical protein
MRTTCLAMLTLLIITIINYNGVTAASPYYEEKTSQSDFVAARSIATVYAYGYPPRYTATTYSEAWDKPGCINYEYLVIRFIHKIGGQTVKSGAFMCYDGPNEGQASPHCRVYSSGRGLISQSITYALACGQVHEGWCEPLDYTYTGIANATAYYPIEG